jgi:two-component system cell cycle response regulator
MSARILIIEDNPTNLQLMVYLLNAYGHTVLTAVDGEAGLQTVRQEAPDLIICDVQIPKIDGYGVARQLKSHPTLRAIPLIAVTALAMVGDRDRVLAAGFDGYIAKPITPQTFVPEVEAFLGRRSPVSVPPAVLPAPEHTEPKQASILVVDNSTTNISLAQNLLEPLGYTVITASSVQEGLVLARSAHPDLILSDLHMPDKDGYAFVKAVKADPQLQPIPFVFISSTVWGEKDRTLGLALGATKFILRPIEPCALVAEIEDCLQTCPKASL